MDDLKDIRDRIDALDERIVELLNERAAAASEIGRRKQAIGAAVFAPDREHEILRRVTQLSRGPIGKPSLLAIYRELMSASFALERPQRIGYLGPDGSYSHEAAMAKFGASVEYEPLLDIRGVFDEIGRRRLDYGVVPVENTTAGAVLDVLDAFAENDVQICSELHLAVHHNLLSNCGIDGIERLYSKPEASAQCRNWLAETGLASKLMPAPSTSRAAELAATEPGAAAIGSRLAAKIYGVQLVATNVEDNPHNATRFLVLGNESARKTGSDRTSLMFTTAHRAGALVEVLLVFQRLGINMTMLTSRPSGMAGREYNFFVDIDGHAEDEAIRAALDEAKQHCKTLRLLGSYPQACEVLAA